MMNYYYYYYKLSMDEQMIYCILSDSMKNRELNVRLGRINADAVERIIMSIEYDHPELYYVNFNDLCFIKRNSTISCRLSYHPSGIYDSRVINNVEREIKTVVSLIKNKNLKSDFEKCRWIHNYILRNVTYNKEAPDNPIKYEDAYDVRGVFLKRTAVCEGISKAFKLICDRLNIDNIIVTGTLRGADDKKARPHAWNIVCLDGFFCHIDVTVDLGVSFSSKHNRYDYFCCPDNSMGLDHIYDGYPDCITDSYSFFRRNNRYFSNSGQLQKYIDEETEKGTKILYFKTELPKGDKAVFIEKIRNQVFRSVKNSFKCSVNKDQMCFFFRIK